MNYMRHHSIFPSVVSAIVYLINDDGNGDLRYQAMSTICHYPEAALFYLIHCKHSPEEQIDLIYCIALDYQLMKYLRMHNKLMQVYKKLYMKQKLV